MTLLLPLLALVKTPTKAPAETPEPAPVVTAAPTAAPAETPVPAPDSQLRYIAFASLCEAEVRFPVPEDIVSAEVTFFDPNFPDEEKTLSVSESAIEKGEYRVMWETHSVREAHPEYYTDNSMECTLSVRVTITHADGRVETLRAERPEAQRFTIACGYDAETDTISVYFTPLGGAPVPGAVVSQELSQLREYDICVWPDVEGFDAAARIETNEYASIAVLPLPETHAELVTVHAYFLPDGDGEPFDFAETVRTTPQKEAAS